MVDYRILMASPPNTIKLERYRNYLRRINNTRPVLASFPKLFFPIIFLVFIFMMLFYTFNSTITEQRRGSSIHRRIIFSTSSWEKQAIHSATPRKSDGFSVLVTGAAGFVGTHCSLALKKRGDGVVGLDNFNSYYDPALKRDRQALLSKHQIFIVEADLNDAKVLSKLFDIIPFTHILHLAAQAGVRYAMKDPQSYIRSNIAGFVNLLEIAKSANPQPSIVWASSSSVYGLNTETPFSESHRTDQPASLYAATKKAGEEIAHTYNHIYGLSMTGLRFFTVYGPWGRPDMAYFFFTKDMLQGKQIKTYEGAARDFTYIDDVVKGCVGALVTAEKSTGSGGKKRGKAQLRVYNLGNTSPEKVEKMVTILEELLNVKGKKQVVKMPRNGDVPYTHANVSLASRDFNYHPTTDLATGLRKFVKWYVRYYGIQSRVKREQAGGS